MSQYELKDGGSRQEFETGAVRDTAEGKGRPELISPFAVYRESLWMEKGAKKYADRNWEKGIPMERCMASLLRHANKYLMGDRSEDHLAAIRFNAGAMIHFEETQRTDLMDLPNYLRDLENENEEDLSGCYVLSDGSIVGLKQILDYGGVYRVSDKPDSV